MSSTISEEKDLKIQALEKQVATQEKVIASQKKQIENQDIILQKQDSKIKSLQEQLNQVYKLLNGFKSERFVPTQVPSEQLNLFGEASSKEIAHIKTETVTYSRKKSSHQGRNKLPEHLPVEEIIIEPKEDTAGLKKIGEEITETLKYTPASLIKIKTIRPKYAKKEDEGILVADLPSRPIEKGIADASLLAYILVSKYVDHQPYYRQISQFKRDFGWEAAQSTLGDWMKGCCKLLEPLYNTLKQKILDSDYLQVDESPIKVLDTDKKGSTHQGYQWVYHDPLQNLVLFDYRKGRGQQGPKELLKDYNGFLQSDGYGVYDKIAAKYNIRLVGCLVHARRKFVDATDNDAKRAEYALDIFRKIYIQERKIKEGTQDFEKRKDLRIQRIKPLFENLKAWALEEGIKIPAKSPIAKAMRYFINQYPKLEGLFLDGRLELDNNLIENKIRPMALGRKNYLFCGSHTFAQYAAMMYSFFASCKAQNINPRIWLQETLEQIPDHNIQKLEELLPGYSKN